MKKLIGLLVLLIVSWNLVLASDPEVATFEAGNNAYAEGNWSQAAEFYRAAAGAGMNNSTLWYNLGCAAWQSGLKGWAVLYFERAARMNPRDPDLKKNLELVRAGLPEPPPSREGLLSFLTLNELMGILLLLVWGFFSLLFFYLRSRKEPLAWGAGVLFLLMLISALSCGFMVYDRLKAPPAVILPEKVEVYSGPGRSHAGAGNLTQGCLVKVLRTEGDWSEIVFREQFKGWVRKEELEKI